MKKASLALLVAACTMSGSVIAKNDHVAIFKNVSGKVDIIRGKSTIPAKPGMALFASDRVISDSSASGGIAFRDGTLVTVGPKTDMEIRHFVFEPQKSKYDFSLYMKQGTAVYSSGKIGKLAPESVNLNTPRAVVGVRGTRFIVEVN